MSEAKVVELEQPIVASNYRRIDKGKVIASVDLTIPRWHLKISSLLLDGPRGPFVSLPSQKFTDRNGKDIWKKLVEFTDDDAMQRFQSAALAAIQLAK